MSQENEKKEQAKKPEKKDNQPTTDAVIKFCLSDAQPKQLCNIGNPFEH